MARSPAAVRLTGYGSRVLLLALACSDLRTKSFVDRPRRDPDTGYNSGDDTDDTGDTGDTDDSLLGWIGSPCETVEDCPYDGAICLTDGFPGGMCSMDCERLCPDEDGYPLTFCVEAGALPSSAPIGDGGCVSRCDFGAYTESGCRDDYGCVVEARANEPSTEILACMPGQEGELSGCYFDLATRGVAFEPTTVADSSPSTHPDLTCHVEDPVYLKSPVHGVDLLYYTGEETERVLAACEMAHALVDTIDDVAVYGVTAVMHIGTYNCRVIADTDTLSRHAYGDAIDIYGFEFDDGTVYTLVDDWEHDTSSPSGAGGAWLYESAYRWYDEHYWNIILTPNYNSVHDNHFHVDLTPGSDYIGFTDGRYIGPAPYYD